MFISTNKVIKKVIFITIVVIGLIPIAQQVGGFIKTKPLKGWYAKLTHPDFSISNWINGSFQKNIAIYLNENFGFRSWFVKLDNQINYWIDDSVSTNSVIIGKNNFLYETSYIHAHLGMDYLGEDSITQKINKLVQLKDTLKKLNIDIIIALAPGKGSYFPEYFPLIYDTITPSTTNYKSYQKLLTKTSISTIDFHKWFLSKKDTTKHPLFAQYGIHWSKYGELLAADSLIKFIEHQRKINLPNIIIDKINLSTIPQQEDYDIGESMNLLFPLSTFEMAYPQFHFNKSSNNDSIKVLTIADSYYWGMFNFGLSKQAFNNSQFWYYNKQIYPDSYDHPLTVDDINVAEEIEKNDVILLLSTDANLYKFPFGFIEKAYNAYFPEIQ